MPKRSEPAPVVTVRTKRTASKLARIKMSVQVEWDPLDAQGRAKALRVIADMLRSAIPVDSKIAEIVAAVEALAEQETTGADEEIAEQKRNN